MTLRAWQYQNYIDEYLNKTLNYYSKWSPQFFVTYFKFDCHDSVVDDRDYVNGGSYRMTGQYSGRKWKQIYLFPVWLVDEHGAITQTDDERGIVRDINFAVAFPDSLGIRPTSKDFIWFYDGVTMMESKTNHPFYIVTNYEVSNMGRRTWYRVMLKNDQNSLTDIRNHISTNWIYIHQIRKIFSQTIGNIVLQSFSNTYDIFNNILLDADSNDIGFDVNKSLYFFNE